VKLLITGAGGFIGSAVVAHAVKAGHDVVATIRPGGSQERLADVSANIEVVAIDLRDSAGVEVMLAAHRPNVIVHVAWSGVSNAARLDQLQINDNIESSCRLLELAAAAGVSKFVGIGSQGEYGPKEGSISETELPNPTTLYGASKLAVHHLTRQLAAQAGMAYAWVRVFAAYGPGDNPHWLIGSLINQMLQGRRPQTTLGEQRWDYLFIDDIASAIVAVAVVDQATGVFNLAAGESIQIRTLVEQIRDLSAPNLELIFGEIPYRTDQIWHMGADITRLKQLTGWAPKTELADGLGRTVQWHRDQMSGAATGSQDGGHGS
jgi:nucleoside-diphosphate-sugar epimerase